MIHFLTFLQILCFSFGIASFGFVFVIRVVPGILTAVVTVFNVLGGPVIGVFFLGMFFPWANSLVKLFKQLGFSFTNAKEFHFNIREPFVES
jgi:hypothetical protein